MGAALIRLTWTLSSGIILRDFAIVIYAEPCELGHKGRGSYSGCTKTRLEQRARSSTEWMGDERALQMTENTRGKYKMVHLLQQQK